MGVSLKGIGRAISKGVKDVGHFAGKAASNPFVQGGLGLLTGGVSVPLIAGAAGGLLKPGGNPGEALKGAASGAVAGKIGSSLAPKGGLGLGGLVRGGGADGKGNFGTLGDVAEKVAKGLPFVGGGGGDGGFNFGKALDLGLGTAGAINAAQLAGKSSDFANRASDVVNSAYQSREPLRLAGVQGMLKPQLTSDPGRLSAFAKRNPFAIGGAS